jgi:glycosyltransferase involved in cell wall biosynthesis
VTSPLVSIVVPTYNSRATLRCALESIQRQDFADFDVWVIGDACTDRSEEVIEALHDNRFHWANRTINSGGSGAGYREGLERSRGRYIAYLGHDDLWFPWHLSSLVEWMTSQSAEFVHGLTAIFGADGWLQIAGPPDARVSYRGHFVPPSSWMHERSLVERVGGWQDPDQLPSPVDMDLLQRFVASGARISHSPRLSVLKWPSAFWRSYADDAQRPQIAIAGALAVDPRALAERILNDFAASVSRQTWRDRARTVGGEWRDALSHGRAALRLTARQAIQPNGRARWPFGSLLRWRYQNVRRQYRARRGLEEPGSQK